MEKESKIIAVDFDGTCVTNRFPDVGYDIGAARVLKRLTDAGHRIVLLTMRDPSQRLRYRIDTLAAAVRWFHAKGIPLYGINENPDQSWSDSRKVYADLYIDDQALGIPTIIERGGRQYVDWNEVEMLLRDNGYL